MVVDKLYRISYGNRTEAIGFILKGATVNVSVLGSQGKPSSTSDMEDLGDGAITERGTYGYAMLPEYVYFDGEVSGGIEIINGSAEDLGVL